MGTDFPFLLLLPLSSYSTFPPAPHILEFLLLRVSSDLGITLSRVGILNPEFMAGLEIIGKFLEYVCFSEASVHDIDQIQEVYDYPSLPKKDLKTSF